MATIISNHTRTTLIISGIVAILTVVSLGVFYLYRQAQSRFAAEQAAQCRKNAEALFKDERARRNAYEEQWKHAYFSQPEYHFNSHDRQCYLYYETTYQTLRGRYLYNVYENKEVVFQGTSDGSGLKGVGMLGQLEFDQLRAKLFEVKF